MRVDKEQLEAIKKKYQVDELWSFSKANTYVTSPFCYYLKYIKHCQEDKKDGIYAESGSSVHNILERFYNGEIAFEDMAKEYELALMVFDSAGLQYNKTDLEKNAKIANKYEACIKHFFKNHRVFQEKSLTEQFTITQVGPYIFQGYIDFIMKSDDGLVTIVDFKTSTIYKGAKINKECKQLLLYAQSLIQHGVPIEKIRIQWDFLKYVKVKYQQKNGEWKEREIERNEIGSKLSAPVKTKLKEYGCSKEEIERYIENIVVTNSLIGLPDSVRNQFEFSDCLVDIPLNHDVLSQLNEELISLLDEIKQKTSETNQLILQGRNDEAEKIWWDSEENLKAQEYYFYNLCGFSSDLHKPWGAYLKKKESEAENADNIFYNQSDEDGLEGSDDLAWLDAYN